MCRDALLRACGPNGLVKVQDEAIGCVVGASEQCQQTISHGWVADGHDTSGCSLIVNDATSVPAQRFAEAMRAYDECHLCGCDFECTGFQLELGGTCPTRSTCKPNGRCRQWWE